MFSPIQGSAVIVQSFYFGKDIFSSVNKKKVLIFLSFNFFINDLCYYLIMFMPR